MKMLFSMMDAEAKILFVLNLEKETTTASFLSELIDDVRKNTHFVMIEDSSGSCHSIPCQLFYECISSVITDE